jgi:hypothetical protein
MKAIPTSRREQIRWMLADLKMPGALEAVDAFSPRPTEDRSRLPKRFTNCWELRSASETIDGFRRPCVPRDCRR